MPHWIYSPHTCFLFVVIHLSPVLINNHFVGFPLTYQENPLLYCWLLYYLSNELSGGPCLFLYVIFPLLHTLVDLDYLFIWYIPLINIVTWLIDGVIAKNLVDLLFDSYYSICISYSTNMTYFADFINIFICAVYAKLKTTLSHSTYLYSYYLFNHFSCRRE